MGALSKHKGNAFESTVAKMLTAWYGEDFKRVPASGALRWGNSTWTYGDILPPLSLPLVIECKHHASVSVDDLLGNRKLGMKESQIGKWWFEQTLPDVVRASKDLGIKAEPMLVWRQNRGRIRCMMLGRLFSYCHEVIPAFSLEDETCSVYITDFETYLGNTDPETFKRLI